MYFILNNEYVFKTNKTIGESIKAIYTVFSAINSNSPLSKKILDSIPFVKHKKLEPLYLTMYVSEIDAKEGMMFYDTSTRELVVYHEKFTLKYNFNTLLYVCYANVNEVYHIRKLKAPDWLTVRELLKTDFNYIKEISGDTSTIVKKEMKASVEPIQIENDITFNEDPNENPKDTTVVTMDFIIADALDQEKDLFNYAETSLPEVNL